MIYIGNDIVENDRIFRLINIYGNKFLDKIFSSKEIESIKRKDPYSSYSGKFAAKEASAKALMTSGLLNRVSFKDIEILNKDNGAPFIELNSIKLDKIKNFKISISHTNQYATAVALLELFE
jgi:holo-[acyl-carrier protein] synthase